MKFQYTRLPVPGGTDLVLQPLLGVWLSGPRSRLKLRMLVDSGSTETLIPASISGKLGIPLTEESVELVGFGGAKLEAQIAKVDVEFAFGRFKFKTRAAVHPDVDNQLCVLGHRDFFLRFRVGFYARDGLFTVNDY